MYFERTATASVSVSDSNLYLYQNEKALKATEEGCVPSLLQNEAEFARICDDTVVNDGKLVAVVTKESEIFEETNSGWCGDVPREVEIVAWGYVSEKTASGIEGTSSPRQPGMRRLGAKRSAENNNER